MSLFKAKVLHQHQGCAARSVSFKTFHGEFTTPTFMPVATRAAVNCMDPAQIISTHSQIILGGNTYHMLVAPGMDIIRSLGGMHQMMGWYGPMLTDSGGFQVFSLSKNSKICRITDEGARFKHPETGKVIELTPKTSIQTQKTIGADIIMAFDECTPEAGGREAALAAMDRTHRWLLESKEAHMAQPNSDYGHPQALFGIIQGGSFRDLRERSAELILKAELDGIAIGGEAIGFDMQKTVEIIDWVRPMLPENKLRYTMGVGLNPEDLIEVVRCGIDVFDCVAPTRNARHGALYHGFAVKDKDWVRFENKGDGGRLLIKKAIYAKDDRPILEGCGCLTCQQYSRGYLHYLFKKKQALYASLACTHNIHVMQQTCHVLREVIKQNSVKSSDQFVAETGEP